MSITRRILGASAIAGLGMSVAVRARAVVTAPAAQAPSFFRYHVGDLQVTAVHDGMAYRSPEGLVPNAPPGALAQAMADNFMPADRFQTSFTTLVINTGKKLVLIDTGNGDLGPPTSGTWMRNFRAAGFQPSDIDTVVISHFHGDHINGLRLKDGTAMFPQAEIMVPAPEWAFWTNESKTSGLPEALQGTVRNVSRVFGPMGKDVTIYEWGQEIMPGVVALAAGGHTPGHTAFAVTSGTGKLLIMSDVTNQTSIFARHPTWSAVFDQDAAIARNTRLRMLDIAATERMQVSFYHAPFPATGHILREGDGFALVPTVWNSQA